MFHGTHDESQSMVEHFPDLAHDGDDMEKGALDLPHNLLMVF